MITSSSGDVTAIPARHPGRWVGGVVVLVLLAMLVNTLLTNKNYQWSVVGHYFLSDAILHGLLKTLELTAIAMIGSMIIGTVLAVMRLSPNPIMAEASWIYVWFFRGHHCSSS